MRPFTKSKELPSLHQVTDYLHNEFVRTMKEKKAEIEGIIGKVAICEDMWSSPANKMPFMGTAAAYIVVKRAKKQPPMWQLKSTILSFRVVEGAHDGENLGRYLFGVCRRAGIINVEKKISKVCGFICTTPGMCSFDP